ncbi:hypothetical protein ABW20_dc0104673 [Dactylellina cionopaga]|nr:hypothetical protein ABW20_dc0104673 [Dactylellina cionopaga]
MDSLRFAFLDAAESNRRKSTKTASVKSRSTRRSGRSRHRDSDKAISVHDFDDTSSVSSSSSCNEDNPGSNQQYKEKAHEIFDDFKHLPPSLQRLELERNKNKKWEENQNLSSTPSKNRDSSSARFDGPSKRAPSRALPREIDDDFRYYLRSRHDRNDSPPRSEAWQETTVEIGRHRVPRIDLRNQIIIDPLALTLPPQPRKIIPLGEISMAYQKSLSEDQAKDMYDMGAKVNSRMKAKFDQQKAEKEGRAPIRKVPGPTHLIPFEQFKTPSSLPKFIPKLPFFFLDLIKVTALDYLPGSKAVRPYDWIPLQVGELDSYRTLPAIFWGSSDKEAAAIVFYIFPTTRNINDPISVGIVDGDQGVANIAIDTTGFMSNARIKVEWSGYIDLSRPTIVPHEAIYNISSPAKANEEHFWDAWKGLFKKPRFGGHQYGMTPETRPFENPFRRMQLFESQKRCHGKYTAQMALEKEPLPQRKCDVDIHEDDTDDGSDTVTVLGTEDARTVIGLNEEVQTKKSLSDGETEHNDENDDNEANNSDEKKPATNNWLDSIFDRPPIITLDENVKITKLSGVSKTPQPVRTYEPLTDTKVKENGIVNFSPRQIFTDPSQYQDQYKDTDNESVPKQRELGNFDRRILKIINQCIGIGGRTQPLSSAHTAYLYKYHKVKDTKDLLKKYIKECTEAAQRAEVMEKGYSSIGERLYPWDERVHEKEMSKEVGTQEVLDAWKASFGPGPHPDKELRRNHRMIEEALSHGKTSIPVLWVPRCVLMELQEARNRVIKVAPGIPESEKYTPEERAKAKQYREEVAARLKRIQEARMAEEAKEVDPFDNPDQKLTCHSTMEQAEQVNDRKEIESMLSIKKPSSTTHSPTKSPPEVFQNRSIDSWLNSGTLSLAPPRKNLEDKDEESSKYQGFEVLEEKSETHAEAESSITETEPEESLSNATEDENESWWLKSEDFDVTWLLERQPEGFKLTGDRSADELKAMFGKGSTKKDEQDRSFAYFAKASSMKSDEDNRKATGTLCEEEEDGFKVSAVDSELEKTPPVTTINTDRSRERQTFDLTELRTRLSTGDTRSNIFNGRSPTDIATEISNRIRPRYRPSPPSLRKVSPSLSVTARGLESDTQPSVPASWFEPEPEGSPAILTDQLVLGVRPLRKSQVTLGRTATVSPSAPVLTQTLERLLSKRASPLKPSNRSGRVGKIRIPEKFERGQVSPQGASASLHSDDMSRRPSDISNLFTSRPIRWSAPPNMDPVVEPPRSDSYGSDFNRKRFQTARRGGMSGLF